MAPVKIRDKLWLWGHEAGSHDGAAGYEGTSRITPAEAAYYLDLPNLIMVRYRDRSGTPQPQPPYDQYALALRPLRRVVWSFVNEGGVTEDDEVAHVLELAGKFRNVTGAMMDDFFIDRDPQRRLAVHTPGQLRDIRERLTVAGRRLDLWAVLYTHQLGRPLRDHLAACDVVSLWTWHGRDLQHLERNLGRAEALHPGARLVLGCYLWDYGDKRPLPVESMERQCRAGLRWLQEGRIEGMIFLASCICDLGLESVEWTRRWIAEVGHREL